MSCRPSPLRYVTHPFLGISTFTVFLQQVCHKEQTAAHLSDSELISMLQNVFHIPRIKQEAGEDGSAMESDSDSELVRPSLLRMFLKTHRQTFRFRTPACLSYKRLPMIKASIGIISNLICTLRSTMHSRVHAWMKCSLITPSPKPVCRSRSFG